MLLSQSSWAGRPFTTEDAGVIDAGECELEAFGLHVRQRPDPSERGGWAQVGWGIGFNTQLAVGAGRFQSGDGFKNVSFAHGGCSCPCSTSARIEACEAPYRAAGT